MQRENNAVSIGLFPLNAFLGEGWAQGFEFFFG